jgi:hypothetical protein
VKTRIGFVLSSAHGRNWRKRKGIANIAFGATGKVIPAEIHWYEAHGIGRVEVKIKRLL